MVFYYVRAFSPQHDPEVRRTPVSTDAHRLAAVARMTKALPVVYHVPQVWPLRDGDDVVSVSFPLPRTHATAGAALPVVPQQHLPPPRRVLGVAVAAGRGIGSVRSLLDLEVGPRLPEHFDSLWHGFTLPCNATARSRRKSATGLQEPIQKVPQGFKEAVNGHCVEQYPLPAIHHFTSGGSGSSISIQCVTPCRRSLFSPSRSTDAP